MFCSISSRSNRESWANSSSVYAWRARSLCDPSLRPCLEFTAGLWGPCHGWESRLFGSSMAIFFSWYIWWSPEDFNGNRDTPKFPASSVLPPLIFLPAHYSWRRPDRKSAPRCISWKARPNSEHLIAERSKSSTQPRQLLNTRSRLKIIPLNEPWQIPGSSAESATRIPTRSFIARVYRQWSSPPNSRETK